MYKRNCPGCGVGLSYHNLSNLNKAEKKHSTCFTCSMTNRRSYQGVQNPFFGKKHSIETVEKFKNKDMSYTQTDEFRTRRSETSQRGCDNPMYNHSIYGLWEAKYGKDKANELEDARKDKLSKLNSGTNNPMYGKPTPQGSGNGWSGWYNEWYFRSLRELGYVIKRLEPSGVVWRSAETKDLRIPYLDYLGRQKTYTADFFVDNKLLIEVKPSKLRSSKSVSLKAEAAKLFCQKHGYDYAIVDSEPLATEEIVALYLTGKIRFLERYEIKFKEEYLYDPGIVRDDRIGQIHIRSQRSPKGHHLHE